MRSEKYRIDPRIERMIRTYRVVLDIDVNATSCDLLAVRLVKTDNIKNVILPIEEKP